MTLPPGQSAVDGFPRFGAHLHRPPPPVPADPVLEIGTITVPVADLATLPRVRREADFHCVAGWSATGLVWEGVAFETLYRLADPPAEARYVTLDGLDGHRSIVLLEDALADDVLIADRLDGKPLDGDHGAPARFVSPSQYGFMSCKHLCRIRFHATAPKDSYPLAIKPDARARVWYEERHRYVPGRLLRPFYRTLVPPIRALSARGARAMQRQ